MIAVSMGGVDRGQVLSTRDDPVDELPPMFGREEGVDKDGVSLAVDQRDRIGDPGQRFLSRRYALGGARAPLYEHLPLQREASDLRVTLHVSLNSLLSASVSHSVHAAGA